MFNWTKDIYLDVGQMGYSGLVLLASGRAVYPPSYIIIGYTCSPLSRSPAGI